MNIHECKITTASLKQIINFTSSTGKSLLYGYMLNTSENIRQCTIKICTDVPIIHIRGEIECFSHICMKNVR